MVRRWTRHYRSVHSDEGWAGAIERGRHKGRLSVRREQFKLLQAGNATMGIWLGKQLLGQRDYDRERIFKPADPTRAEKPVVPEWLLK